MSGRCPEQLEGPDGRIRPRRLTAIEARNFLQNILDDSSDDEFSVEEEPDSDLDLDDDIEFRPEIRSSSRSSSNAVHDGEQAGQSSGSRSRERPQTGSRGANKRPITVDQNLDVVEEQAEWEEIPIVDGLGNAVPVRATTEQYDFLPKNRREPGINAATGIDENSSAIDCFRALWTPEVFNQLLNTINNYAEQRQQRNNPPKKRSLIAKWEPLTLFELYKFIAVTITMGIIDMPTVKHYWSGKSMYQSSFFSKLFTRDRFELIFHAMLHVSSTAQAEGKDKIEPFMNALIANFNHAFYPFQSLSLDEMVIGWTGRWIYKQYNASKPKKYHIKTFGLCDANTGYVVNILTYFGRDTSYSHESDGDGAMAVRVFQTLLQVVGKGHHIFADRFYTTRKLVDHLKENSTYYTGTLIANRKGFPKAIQTDIPDLTKKKCYATIDKSILLTSFRDKKAKKPVIVVSTSANTTDVMVKGKSKPSVVNQYNYAMNGCDRVDQMLTYYGTYQRKTYKWWKKLFHWMLEVSQYNAYVLYCLSRPEEEIRKSMLHFKEQLVDGLINLSVEIMPQQAHAEGYASTVGRPRKSVVLERYIGNIHLISFRGMQRKCVHCDTSRSQFFCKGCSDKPTLCPKNCFEQYHTP